MAAERRPFLARVDAWLRGVGISLRPAIEALEGAAAERRAPRRAPNRREALTTTVSQWIAQAPPVVQEQFELVNGRWTPREVPGHDHQRHARLLTNELERRGLQAEGGVRLMLPTGDRLAPDVFVVARGNRDQPGPPAYAGVPDLVVEVMAADNDAGEDGEKKQQYALAGVRHYWLVRLKWMTLEASVLGDEATYHVVSAGALLPLEGLPVPDGLD